MYRSIRSFSIRSPGNPGIRDFVVLVGQIPVSHGKRRWSKAPTRNTWKYIYLICQLRAYKHYKHFQARGHRFHRTDRP